MISAEEARKETTKNLETFRNIFAIELVYIENKIREAIKQGAYSISNDGNLSAQSRKLLKMRDLR
jgi:hypothetical protein